jgi:hypothetical protein
MGTHPAGRPFRPPPRRAGLAALALVLVLPAVAGSRADPAGSFDVQASVAPAPVPQAAAGFQLQGTLTPAPSRIEGGRYSLDALAAPAGVCGSSDVIFRDGFDSPG